MILQVGLQATPRFSGRRPAMNVGVVLDLRHGFAPEVEAQARALLVALLHARDLGDRFSLIIAGEPGGLLLGRMSFATARSPWRSK